MKTSCFISLLVVLVFCACQKTEEHPPVFASRFAEIDTLMSQQPDSALSLLLAMADTHGYDALSAMHQHEFQILLADALYKNDYLQANDSAVQAACLFFDSLAAAHPHDSELRYQQARALYYKAVGLQEKDQPVEACGDFFTALQMMEQTENLSPAQNHLAALACCRLANLYFSYDAFDIAIECAKRSNDYYEKESDTKSILNNYNLIGRCFSCNQMADSAMRYYDKADSLAQIVYPDGKHPIFWALLRNKILIAISNDTDYVFELLETAFNMAQTEEERSDYHIFKGEYLYNMQQYDSALYYYEKADVTSFYHTLHISDRLLDIAKQMGDTARMTRYALVYGENSKKEMDNNPQKPLMVSLYEQHQRQKAQQEKTTQWVWVIVFVVIVVVAGLYIGRLMKKKKDSEQEANEVKQQLFQSQNETEQLKLQHQQETEDLQQGLRQSESEKEQMKLQHQQKTADLQQRLRQSENEKEQMKLQHQQETEDFQQQLFQAQDEKMRFEMELQQREADSNTALSVARRLKLLREMPVCQTIFSRLRQDTIKTTISKENYSDLVLSEEQKTDLIEAVDALFPLFQQKLAEKYHNLKKDDMIYFHLYLLDLNEKQIGVLVNRQYNTVCERSKRYKEYFGKERPLAMSMKALLK